MGAGQHGADCLVWLDIVPELPLCGGLSSMRPLSASGG
jgi:hypothetical protein